MRILITGGTGFLGSHLAHRLSQTNADLALLLRPQSNRSRLDPLPVNLQIINGSLQNIADWKPELSRFQPDAVIHLAWSGVGNKHRNDAAQIDENLQPTIELVRASIAAGATTFIGSGSQAEYGPLNKKISEQDQAAPTTLYGAAKLATSILAQQLCVQAGIRFAWLRVFSTYGPMEDPNWMIPYLIRSLLKREKPSLTACEQKWDYLFAPDAAEAICAVIQKNEAKGVFNLGSGRVYTLRQIVETIRNNIDPMLPIGFGEVPYRPDQVMHLEADISRLTSATGWNPATSLEEGLRQTIAWHKSQLEKKS